MFNPRRLTSQNRTLFDAQFNLKLSEPQFVFHIANAPLLLNIPKISHDRYRNNCLTTFKIIT